MPYATTLFLILVIAAIVPGIIGAVAKGLFYLLMGSWCSSPPWCTWECTCGAPAGTGARCAEDVVRLPGRSGAQPEPAGPGSPGVAGQVMDV
ncbi:hypothetical protein [Streptomyces halobius]|uniref:Uncharacterized protein n=1 Tax=Streptomyces halobius TaxID=2879846 RepID=A0ABY4M1X2_9ACTN|nr:hypothetical protein [Streptomyces halobius]UQA91183.1 hypothetical protein K9S39_04150 [Streptomyces halobius]